MYTPFPQPETNVTPRGTYPKLSYEELARIYDELTALGLYVLPKQLDKKVPVADYWRTDNPLILTDREEALSWQARSNVSGWTVVTGSRSNRVIVLDIDTKAVMDNGADPYMLYDRIQSMSPNGFVLHTPSNGVHLYYRIPDDKELLTNAAPPVRGLDVRGEGGQVITLGGFNRYDNNAEKSFADKKGVADGHTAVYKKVPYGEYDNVPDMSDELYAWLTSEAPKGKKKKANIVIEGENYKHTEVGKARLDTHFRQPVERRVAIVQECLKVILSDWNAHKTYDEWLQLWMSSHHGSDGSTHIRDIFLLHPAVYWSDGEDGRAAFIKNWSLHEYRSDGYTVASLFWLAKQSGWMMKTGYEIAPERMRHVNYRYITDWIDTLEEVPNRLLLTSQTGSGKTYAIKCLYERLNKPKTVIFVPTKKLATELAMTLRNGHGLPVVLYRDADSGEVADLQEMIEAQVLVTTLQTFATRLKVPMSDYGLVYVEESDQLLAQFARGGGGIETSHVDEKQARRGFAKIRDAMTNSGVVWFVDATMSKVTLEVAEQMYKGYIEVVSNQWVAHKPMVTILTDKGMAYQKVLEGLLMGQRVVVAADTAHEAEMVHSVMEQVGVLEGKKSIVITRHTENKPAVIQFMQDVNGAALEYDLVCYNSVMASGVSINSVRPDVLVQIANYLPPRANLQILNRYRLQEKVYCYYMPQEAIYAKSAEQLVEEVEIRTRLESMLSNMPIAARIKDADLRKIVATISIADAQRQMRAPREFYIGLLRDDGRSVEFAEARPMIAVLEHSLEAVKELLKLENGEIAAFWNEVPPIDNDRPAKPEYTDLEVAKGETHAHIERTLRGVIPDLDKYTARYVYDVVKMFAPFAHALTAFVKQEVAIKRIEHYLADRGRALTTITSTIALIQLMATVSELYKEAGETLSPEVIKERSAMFMRRLREESSTYDVVITRGAQKFDIIADKYAGNEDEQAVAFSKIILAKVGLKQRAVKVNENGTTRYHYSIENLEQAMDFLRWRNHDDTEFRPSVLFTDEPIRALVEGREQAVMVYETLSAKQREKVFDFLEQGNVTDFTLIVDAVASGKLGEW